MLTDLMRLSNNKAISNKHDLHIQFESCSVFTNKRICEPLGFGPMLCSWNGCLNVLLMLKVI